MATLEATMKAFEWIFKEQKIGKINDVIGHTNLPFESVLNPKKLYNRSKGAKYNSATGKLIIPANKTKIVSYAGAEKGAPISSDLSFQDMSVDLKYVRAKFVLYDVDFEKVKNSKQAVINLANEYTRGMRQASNDGKARHMLGDGTGIIGVLPKNLAQATDELIISNDWAWTADSQNFYAKGTYKFLEPGMKIEIGKKVDFENKTTVKATIADRLNDTTLKLTATLSSPVGWTNTTDTRGWDNSDTYYIIPLGEYEKAPAWIFSMVSNATEDLNFPFRPVDINGDSFFQGKVRKNVPYLNSIVHVKEDKTNVVKDIRRLYTEAKIFNRGWGGSFEFFVLSTDVYDAYTDKFLDSNKINITYNSKIGAEHRGLEFSYGWSGKISIHEEDFLPAGTVILLNPEQMGIYHLAEWPVPWYINKAISTSSNNIANWGFGDEWGTGYETVWRSYMNFFTYNSQKMGAILRYES